MGNGEGLRRSVRGGKWGRKWKKVKGWEKVKGQGVGER